MTEERKMTPSAADMLPQMSDSTSLLDEPETLRSRFYQDGYVFLRGVLDRKRIQSARHQILKVLEDIGLTDADGRLNPAFCYPDVPDEGGRSRHLGRHTPQWLERRFEDLGVSTRLRADRNLRYVLEKVAGGPIRFLPMLEYRCVPPTLDTPLHKFHQDACYNPDLQMLRAWIPLAPISRQLGGLAVAEGMHTNGYHAHDDVPSEAERTSDYVEGDIVIFHRMTPHKGLPNRTADTLRFSFDFSFQPVTVSKTTAIGEILEAHPDLMVIVVDGRTMIFRIDEDTFLRDRLGTRIDRALIETSELASGAAVLLAHEQGKARLVRLIPAKSKN
jgi:hypothetical protein